MESMNVFAAEQFCVGQGAQLALVSSQEEKDDVLKKLNDEGLTYNPILLGGKRNTEKDKWEWLDGTAWSYQNWYEGQPYNDTGLDCMMVAMGSWYSQSCEYQSKFICASPMEKQGNFTLVLGSESLTLKRMKFGKNFYSTDGTLKC